MATAKKAPAKKTTTRKAAPKKSENLSIKESAEKAVNIYLGVIGKSIDSVQDNLASARKENEKRMKDLEKRGAKLRKELSRRVEDFEVSAVMDDAKEQFNKVQDQVEEAIESARDRLSPSKAA